MDAYLELAETVLQNGVHESNRTGVDTIVAPTPQSYTVDVGDGYPLLTTKDMSGYRWDSMMHEVVWYLSGEHHIRDLREKTKIWDAWADDDYNLPTAYGRFWRRYPVPDDSHQLPGEWWVSNMGEWVGDAIERYDTTEEELDALLDRWVTEEENGVKTLDQIQYVVDTLNGKNPMRSPGSRRLMVSAWHPANATVSHLPPCHTFWGVNVIDGKLNLHLTQRSGDIAVGIPFNIACYTLILKVLAQITGYEVGAFSHTILNAHIYCGDAARGEWYEDNLGSMQNRFSEKGAQNTLESIESRLPEDNGDVRGNPLDHVPGLLKQVQRDPLDRPEIEIADVGINELQYEDIELVSYESHDGIPFGVAE